MGAGTLENDSGPAVQRRTLRSAQPSMLSKTPVGFETADTTADVPTDDHDLAEGR